MAIRDIVMRIRTKVTGKDDVKGLTEAFKEQESQLKKLNDTFGKVTIIGTKVAGVASLLSIGTTALAAKVADAGDQFLDLRNQFDDLAKAGGFLSDVLLNDLQKATDDAIANADLFKIANKAATLELNKMGVDLVKLADNVKDFSDATGGDAVGDLDAFIQAIASGRVTMLATRGVVVDTIKAVEDYAASHGKAVSELSEFEKQSAKAQAAAASLSKAVSKLGNDNQNAGDAAQTLQAQVQNLRDDFIGAFAENESLRDSLSSLAKDIKDFDVKPFADALATIASLAVDVSSGILAVLDVYERLVATVAGARGFVRAADTMEQFNVQLERLEDRLSSSGKTPLETLALTMETIGDEIDITKEKLSSINQEISDISRLGDARTQTILKNSLLPEQERLVEFLLLLEKRYDAQKIKVDKYVESIQKGLVFTKETVELTKEQSDAIKKLTADYEKLIRETENKTLADALKEAARVGDSVAFDELSKKLEAATLEGVLAGYGEAANTPEAQAIAKKIAKAQSDAQLEAIQGEVSKELEEAHKSSVDFYQSLMVDAINGDIGDAFESIATRFVTSMIAELLASSVGGDSIGSIGQGYTGGFGGFNIGSLGNIFQNPGAFASGASGEFLPGAAGAGTPEAYGAASQGAGISGSIQGGANAFAITNSLSELSQIGQSDQETVEGILTAGGAAIGYVIGGPIGGAIGSAIGDITADALNDFFGSGKNKTEQLRDKFKDEVLKPLLDGSLVIDTIKGEKNFGKIDFGADLDLSNPLLEQGVNLTKGLALALTGGGELGVGANSIFAQAVADADNLTEVMINAISLFDQMGLEAEDLKVHLATTFLDGETSLEDFIAGLNSLREIGAEDIESATDAILAMGKTIETSPRQSITALKLAFEELAREGIDSADEIRAYFTDRFGVEIADSLARLFESGLLDFENLTDLNPESIAFIATEIDKIAHMLDDAGEIDLSASSGDAVKATNEMSSSMRNFRTEVDETTLSFQAMANEADRAAGRISARFRILNSEARSLNETLAKGEVS